MLNKGITRLGAKINLMNLLIKLPFINGIASKLIALSFIFVLASCGDAVENLELRAQLEKIASTSSISTISPAYGTTAGGTTLTITGQNLDLVNSISLGSGSCSIVTASGSVITCTTSTGTAGSQSVIITNTKGKTAIYPSAFDYLDAPTVTSITPNTGTIAGSETVTITGTDFYQISSITLNGVACTSPVTVSSTTATCTTGSTTAGTGNVVVTNADSQFDTLVGGFTYVNPPTIVSFSPTTISEAGGETLTITGTDFAAGAQFDIEIETFSCATSTFINSTTVECVTNPYSSTSGTGTDNYGDPGADEVSVVVTNGDGGSDTATIDYIPAPILTSVDIEYGQLAGTDTITLTGEWFASGGSLNVSMATVDCTSETVIDRNTIECVTAASGPQSGDVVLTNFDGQQVSLTPNAFTYRAAPTVTSVTANNGPESGATSVTIAGTGFSTDGNVTVTFGGNTATNVSVTNETTITCDTPSGSGTVDVVVTNVEDNQPGTGSGAFTYNPAPVISAVTTPATPFIDYGPVAGGNTIEIQGSNFVSGLTVTVGGNGCTVTSFFTTAIECTVPAGASAGSVNVVVTNPDGQTFTSSGSYNYRNPPNLSAVSPIAGPIVGGQVITLTGNDIMPNPSITVNGNPCTVGTLTGDHTITCTTPDNTGSGGAVNDVDIIITNEDTQTDNTSLVGSYDYIPAPTVTGSTPESANPIGGDTITINGSDFYVAGGVNATIDGIDCVSISNLTTTSFDCIVPAHGSAQDLVIQVENLVDGQTGDSTAFFDYVGPPTLTNFYFEVGKTNIIEGGTISGGNTIWLEGNDFITGMTVDIGTVSCTGVTIIDIYNAYCTVDTTGAPHTAQAEDVVLTNLDTQTSTSTGAYEFRPAPTYTSVTPDYGDINGGSTVTVVGTNFTTGVTLEIDGVACSSTTNVTTTSFDCVVPAHIAATGLDIQILNTEDQQRSALQTTVFDYIGPPVITSIEVTDNTGAALYGGGVTDLWETNDGAQYITITGTELRADGEVTIDGNTCTDTGNGTEPTSYICLYPDGSGSATLTYTNADGQTDTLAVTYIGQPTIDSYDLSFGPVDGSNSLTITGTNFVTGAVASITGVGNCTSTTFNSATELVCDLPDATTPGDGVYDVVVTNPNGDSFTDSTTGYEYIDPPNITSTDMDTYGIHGVGGQVIQINGNNFMPGVTVQIGGNDCTPVTYVDRTEISCTTPASDTPLVQSTETIAIANLDGQAESTYTIDYYPAPIISNFETPEYTDGGMSNGATVTITGSNFIAGDTGHTVSINSVPCNIAVAGDVTATTIDCTYTSGSGTGDVVVTLPDGQSVIYGTQFFFYPGPTITSVSPPGGKLAGGDTINIFGTGFYNNTNGPASNVDVLIGGVSCTTTTRISDTQVDCIGTPPHAAGVVDVDIVNGDGRAASPLASGFQYVGPPTIASVDLSNAPESLATSLTITGTGFETYTTAPSVTVDTVACSSVTVNSDTELVCITSPSINHTTRAVNIVVTNIDGQPTTGGTGIITYDASPRVDSTDILYGDVAGGDTVVITGANFVSGAVASIGGVNCASTTFDSATQLTCVTAATASGSYNVVATNPDGQVSDDTVSFIFSNPPSISAVTDDFDEAGVGGKTITITGTDFVGVSNVTIGGAACTGIDNTGEPTSITCVTPNRTVGQWDVVVTNATGQQDTLTNGIEYEDTPTFSGITDGTDAAGSVNGGETVTITGTNFALGVSVTIGGVNCTGLFRVNATTLTCSTPTGTVGTTDVVITNQTPSLTVTASGVYTFQNDPPTVTGVSPQGGDIAGGDVVTITGTNFSNIPSDPTVIFDPSGTPANCTSITNFSSTSFDCTTSAHAQGLVDVYVQNADGNDDTLSGGFLYSPKATISSISPPTGSSSGGSTVTVNGTNFSEFLYSVDIGGAACTNITHINATSFTCDIGANTAGTYNPSITQLYQTDTSASTFTYSDSANLNWVVGGGSPTPPNPADYFSTSVNVGYTFTIENNGVADSTAISLSLTGTNPGAWTIGTDTCSGNTLTAGATCTVQIIFIASFLSSGSYSANIEATATSGGTTINGLVGTVP